MLLGEKEKFGHALASLSLSHSLTLSQSPLILSFLLSFFLSLSLSLSLFDKHSLFNTQSFSQSIFYNYLSLSLYVFYKKGAAYVSKQYFIFSRLSDNRTFVHTYLLCQHVTGHLLPV